LGVAVVDRMLDEDFTPSNLRIDLVAPVAELVQQLSADVNWEEEHWYKTYAHVCSRMLTYAHVCSRMHIHDVKWEEEQWYTT
jgi:hypothetical protein